MDFYTIAKKIEKDGSVVIWPNFAVRKTHDLMVRAGHFYAIWDEEARMWSTDEMDVVRLVDQHMHEEAQKLGANYKSLRSYDSGLWTKFRKYLKDMGDNHHQLDEKLIFANTETKRSDYASKRLPYSLEPGDHSAWDELLGTLYSVNERAKLEWTIGAIVSGDSRKIQKFVVLFGSAGTGKSTILNIIEQLFTGYIARFSARELGSANNTFATEAFRHGPLVAIEHDGDLSRIEDNSKINSIVSHETMSLNEKYKSNYEAKINALLLIGTNKPVKISDAKSGLIRRLIDVHPTGVTLPINQYLSLMSRVEFELGAIAHHCLHVYLGMGKNYYNGYRPLEMMFQTDIFFNYIESHFDVFKAQDMVSLKQAYILYKEYCSDTGIDKPLPQYKFREELKNYFDEFRDRAEVDGQPMRSVFMGFNANKFKAPTNEEPTLSLVLDKTESIFDEAYLKQPAQYAKEDGTPEKPWSKVHTTLEEIDSRRLHYVKVPENHIIIDFDLKDEDGRKSLERNLAAASNWPPTYAELSKSGGGVHLHYTYIGTGHDPSELHSHYSEGIEVKSYTGNGAVRRRLTKCNGLEVAHLPGGLPLKEKKVLSSNAIQSEKGLRDLIARNLKKEIHPGTKPSIDFIKKILDDAYLSDLEYDVTDLRSRILSFANNSTNRALECLKIVQTMKFHSEEGKEGSSGPQEPPADDRLVFYDVEVYPNLFVVCWKFEGDSNIVAMVNPSAQEIENLVNYKLVGYNNRRYDNHILYGRIMGYNNQQLFELSKKLINDKTGPRATFGEAYGLSHTDIYDFTTKKQSLKKYQVELGLKHQELDISWEEPVDESRWDEVVEYCKNDVLSTEATFKSRSGDWMARKILADVAELSPNDSTAKLTARIVFGKDRDFKQHFKYTKLDKMFPGYTFERGVSKYRDEVVGEGGYVYAEPGIYENVALLDVASMHPTSIKALNLFGDYTESFAEIMNARLAIKRGQFDAAKKMLGGKLAPYLEGKTKADTDDLSYALKIAINTVYGLTSAKFENPFRDARNVDNIVAKRGALFMIDLKHFVQERGFTVAHIKTDSIKIPNATPEIIKEVIEFGAKYGYEFEHEATYEKFGLVNDAVYVALSDGKWTAVGAQFQHPVVYKTLFSKEATTDADFVEIKQVQKGHMYLDFDGVHKPMCEDEGMRFIGKIGAFVPVTEESGGGILYRVNDEKRYAVTGTKGYFWMEHSVYETIKGEVEVDMSYFENLVTEAADSLARFGDVEKFLEA